MLAGWLGGRLTAWLTAPSSNQAPAAAASPAAGAAAKNRRSKREGREGRDTAQCKNRWSDAYSRLTSGVAHPSAHLAPLSPHSTTPILHPTRPDDDAWYNILRSCRCRAFADQEVVAFMRQKESPETRASSLPRLFSLFPSAAWVVQSSVAL